MAGIICLLTILLTFLKSLPGWPCQHPGKCRNAGTNSERRWYSLGGKVLLSMGIDAPAARTPECSM